MPTYQYRCKECGADLEVVQKFTDDSLTTCPACGADALRKVYNAVGVHFKGSGFYRTDSRSDPGRNKTGTQGPDKAPAKESSAGSASGTSGAASTSTSSSSGSSSSGTTGSSAS